MCIHWKRLHMWPELIYLCDAMYRNYAHKKKQISLIKLKREKKHERLENVSAMQSNWIYILLFVLS